jgi:hypothetical protein
LFTSDIKDWPAPTTVPSIIRHSPNVQIVGFDGLVNIDLDAMKAALLGASELEELRCCGEYFMLHRVSLVRADSPD